jgi:UDP-N-acetylmuramoylalanine--D-glutamate ligase
MELALVKEALVVGLGISGRAAAGKLLREGKQVVVNDLSISAPVEKAAAELTRKGAKAALGHHDFTLLEGTDLVVVSPGVAGNLPLLTEARSRGIPVWSEIELAWRFARGPVIAVTGTNGKTTTVSMIESILKQAGRPAVAAGNIGFPLVKAVEEADEGDVLVVEVSSFQLAYIEDFRPDVAILLNIAEDHFDWHDHMGEYIEAKSRIWMNQGEGDLVVTNLDDPLCVQAAAQTPSRRAFFSRNAGGQAATYLKNGIIFSYIDNGGSQQSRPIIEVHDMKLVGGHNLENAMAAASAALVLGVSPEAVKLALRDFAGLEHRLQLVAETGGIKFYNDSKATNPHATMRALSAFEQPLLLILGGRNKGLDFKDLATEVAARWSAGGIRIVYAIGEAGPEIKQALTATSPHIETSLLAELEEVFEEISSKALPGDVILFSPACASFDRYENYKQRGKHFQLLVGQYSREEGSHG